MIFDTHAHYDDEAFKDDRELVLASLKEANISTVVNVGASIETSKQSLKLADTHDYMYCAIGVHPSDTGELTKNDLDWIKSHAHDAKVVAIGEIGLDYYWDTPDREVQKKWFYEQLLLAIREELPVIIHSREAAADTLELMKCAAEYAKQHNKPFTGVIHCFSYTKEMAKEYIDMGFYLGIGGVVTFKNAKKVREVVEYAGLSSLVLETDCPYLAPEPNRGTRNDSRNLTYVINQIADLLHVSRQEVITKTTQNAKKLYRLS